MDSLWALCGLCLGWALCGLCVDSVWTLLGLCVDYVWALVSVLRWNVSRGNSEPEGVLRSGECFLRAPWNTKQRSACSWMEMGTVSSVTSLFPVHSVGSTDNERPVTTLNSHQEGFLLLIELTQRVDRLLH